MKQPYMTLGGKYTRVCGRDKRNTRTATRIKSLSSSKKDKGFLKSTGKVCQNAGENHVLWQERCQPLLTAQHTGSLYGNVGVRNNTREDWYSSEWRLSGISILSEREFHRGCFSNPVIGNSVRHDPEHSYKILERDHDILWGCAPVIMDNNP